MMKFGLASLLLSMLSMNAFAASLNIEGIYDHPSFQILDNGKIYNYDRPSKVYIQFNSGIVTTYTFSSDERAVEIKRDTYTLQDNNITIIEGAKNPCTKSGSNAGVLDGNHLVVKQTSSGLQLSQESKVAKAAIVMTLKKASVSQTSLDSRVENAKKACIGPDGTVNSLN